VSDISSPSLSLVMPVRDGNRDLVSALESLLPFSTDSRWQLIVVDDASREDVAATTSRYREAGLPVKCIRLDESVGPGLARNAGVAACTSSFVAFVDVDDQVLLEPLLDLMETAHARDVTLVSARHRLHSQDDQAGAQSRGSAAGDHFTECDWRSRLLQPPAVWSFLYRSDIFDEPGLRFPALSYAEDVVFLIRLSRVVKTFMRSEHVVYVHRKSGQPITPSASSIARSRFSVRQSLESLDFELALGGEIQQDAIRVWKLRIAGRFLLAREPANVSRTRLAWICLTSASRHPAIALGLVRRAVQSRVRRHQLAEAPR
jgi:glycosyltransferase involved in cell wall biosynthesis